MRGGVTEHRGELRVGADDPCLEGHFPGRPLVPAAAILDRLAAWLEAVSGAAVAGVARARFPAALTPGTTWQLHAEAPAQGRCKVTCRHDGAVAARVTFVLADPAP